MSKELQGEITGTPSLRPGPKAFHAQLRLKFQVPKNTELAQIY